MADQIADYDRQLVRGDCFTVTVIYKDNAGDIIDMTGYDAQLGVYDLGTGSGGTHWLGDKSSSVTGAGAGTVSISVSSGVITATVPRTITQNWLVQKKSAKYQLAVLPSGSGACRTTILTGFIEVEFGPIPSAAGV